MSLQKKIKKCYSISSPRTSSLTRIVRYHYRLDTVENTTRHNRKLLCFTSLRALPSFMGSSAISCSIFLQPRLLAVRQICIVLWLSLLGVKKKKIDKIRWNINSIPLSIIRGVETAIYGCHCPELWRCASLKYWPGQGFVYVCPLPFVCVTEMGCFRVTLLKAVSKRG